ncbi:LysR family transcriptional regulator [Kiloniella laminariae]|uniref:LysR family transcriptional regulator n=1 Tax=Kiloniella laminariae TaxID=454162 RepID=A0ABT4LPJ7_9PROT|nr:LysR family transcriptional regulator [Kiloniella laminariae]MCZ4283038.1 LysR family transcriptional regulator [Kiloniella laminariae]
MTQPSIAQVSAFFAVYTHGSTVKAAKALGKSQSIVSANISRLEDSLGGVLFERANGRLRPTERANTLASHARSLLEAYQTFSAQGNSGGYKRFVIAAPRSLSMTFLPGIAKNLQQKNHGLILALQFLPYQQIINDVAEGIVDVGITKLPVLDDRVLVHPVCDAPSVVVMPKDHPLAAKKLLKPADIGQTPMIRLGSGLEYWEKIELAFNDVGIRANFTIEVGGVGPACRMVREGMGIAIVNQLMAAEYLEILDLTYRRFSPDVIHQFAWVSSPFSESTKLISQFGAALKQGMASLGLENT